MKTLFNDGEFYNGDYYERGKTSGKGWLENYRWLPRRSFKEAFAFIDYMELNEKDYVLDIGCAKGFLVRAMNGLGIHAEGCDISDYALSFAGVNCWNSSSLESWSFHVNTGYTHAICKDVLEHLTIENLKVLLGLIRSITPKFMCVVPIGDNGIYRIKEYHLEVSHVIAEDECWWVRMFKECGWELIRDSHHVPGLKDNWQVSNRYGNHAYYLQRI